MKRYLPLLLALFSSALLMQSCSSGKTAVSKTPINNCVTSAELSNLNIGMSKSQALDALGQTYPYDVLAGDFDGCEVFQYKYKKPKKKSKAGDVGRLSLTEGLRLFVDESDAYLLFKEGKLEMVLTAIGRAQVMDLLKQTKDMEDACAETGLRGCTDTQALNYNESAIIESGTCEYCPCYYEMNPDFNKKRPVSDCNARCVPIRTEEFVNGELVVKVGGKVVNNNKQDVKTCNDCDIIEQLANSKANVNVTIDMGASSGQTMINRTTITSDSKSKVSAQAKANATAAKAKAKLPQAKKPDKTKVAKIADADDSAAEKKPRRGLRTLIILVLGFVIITGISNS
ncbi:MAG: hypothetical protein ACK5BL_01435 [Flavobacteriales bacterium]|jgi:hypothetical protein